MNSEHILARFGSYAVRVLHQDNSYRVASLCSIHDGADVCRTLAVTHFASPVPAALREADALIRQGQSIGSTLKNAGLALSRTMLAEGNTSCGAGFARLAGEAVAAGDEVVVRLYELCAGTDASIQSVYATIAEAHHPQHVPSESGLDPLHSMPDDAWSRDARGALNKLLAAMA